jgi:NADH:ubiquinone oxidoreductase subunit 2 (subunit N)
LTIAILCGVSSAFLLFGMAILYAGLGTLSFAAGAARDADLVDDYRGLLWRRPGLALAFAAALLSVAGIPLTEASSQNSMP